MAYIIGIFLNLLSFAAVLVICVKYIRLRDRKENEHYTDYTNGNMVMRVFKNEFEYPATKNLNPAKILDGGALSAGYRWVLFEK